jgi:hypothetical protein
MCGNLMARKVNRSYPLGVVDDKADGGVDVAGM